MKKILFLGLMAISINSFGWGGYDYESGSYVEIEKGNLVRSGLDIEVYDYDSGEYKDYEVESITNLGSSTEVEIYDHDTGEYRTLEMD